MSKAQTTAIGYESGSLAEANRNYRSGSWQEALAGYKYCLNRMTDMGAAPKTILEYCKQQISRCSEKIYAELSIIGEGNQSAEYSEIRLNPQNSRALLPKVSIVIPNFNSAKFLYEALDSIAAQKFREVESIIIDDASTDDLVNIDLLAAYPDWMRIVLLRMQRNSGPARCRNLGIAKSVGRAICLLDADDRVDPDAIQSRWQLLNQQPEIAAAFVPMAYVDGAGRPLGATILSDVEGFTFTDFASNKFPCSALMFRRRALVQDQFNEALLYGEDYECFSRIAQRGGVFRRAPSGLIQYRQHGASLTHKDTRRDLEQRLEVTSVVHSRQLNWAHGRTKSSLAVATMNREGSLRAFPVACIYALRGRIEDALAIADSIDPDMVAAIPVGRMKGTIRFFLTREERIPTGEIDKFLLTVDEDALMKVFDAIFFTRHRIFVVSLLKQIFGRISPKIAAAMPRVMTAPIKSMTWNQVMASPIPDFGGYILLHRVGEYMPEQAMNFVRSHLSQRADLEGLFVYRMAMSGSELFTDFESLAPADPDAAEIARLGMEYRPAVILHEMTARAIWHWVADKVGSDALSNAVPSWVEEQFLKCLAILRVKIAGGLPECFVLSNTETE
jgi:glycosyltransferase involved in cell wall biosynthesis